VALTGCSGSLPANFGVAQPTTQLKVSGKVIGGQNPVVGASVQLYAVNTGSTAGGATALIASPPATGAGGSFNITGMYNCAGYSDVYLVATGGNPGGGTNSSLTLVAALGQCSALTQSTNILMNELTTVAAAYALAPFATGIANVGSTNATALDNAFQMASVLVNTANGQAGSGDAVGVTVPVAEINTLGNIVAACVNSQGSGTSGSPCSQLFAATGATETFGASLGIAKAPGSSAITALYTLSSAAAPFQPSMSPTAAPNDFSLAVNYAGVAGTLNTPYAIAIDAKGNAWVTNESGQTVTEFSPTGVVLATPTASGLVGAQGIAISSGGSVWVANTAGNSIVAFSLTGGAVTGTNVYTPSGLAGPTGIAFDGLNNVFVSNFNGNSVIGLSSSGAPLSFSPITNAALTNPHALACGGPNGDIYVTSGSGAVLHFSDSTGALVSSLTDNTLQGPAGVSYDLVANHVFATGTTTGSTVAGALSEFSSADAPASTSPVVTGIASPTGVATDGVSAWVTNDAASGSLEQYQYGATGSASPAAGYGSLNSPVGVAVDAMGSVWTANSGSNTVSVFVGLAQPVVTPIAASVK
jgi:sugar lactone lactonase YvrE